MAQAADTHNQRQPGDFQRHPHTGAPYVNHPTETTAKGRPKRVQYGRPSSLGKQIENATNLQKWAERAVALGAFLDFTSSDIDRGIFDDLDTLDVSKLHLDDPDARPLLDAAAAAAKDRAQANLAAERGTFTHELTEIFDEHGRWLERAREGASLDIPTEAGLALVEAWDLLLEDYGLQVDVIEQTVVDDEWRQAGTLDRIATLTQDIELPNPLGEPLWLPSGITVVLDIKTGQLRSHNDGHPMYWHGYAVQVASYAQGVPYDVETDERGEWPTPVDQSYAVIAHLDVRAALDQGEARACLIGVDLERGRHAGRLCIEAKEWEKSRDVFTSALGQCVAVPVGESVPTPTPPPVEDDIDRRQDLRHRFERMRANASDTGWLASFMDSWRALGITPESSCDEVEAALDTIEPPFEPAEPTPRIGRPAVDPPIAADTTPDEGGPMGDETLTHLTRVFSEAPDEVKATVNGWLAESVEAGASFDPRFTSTVRRFEITRAALRLATATSGDEQCVGMLLGHVVANGLALTGSIGGILGRLTIDRAKQLTALADAFGDTLTLIYREDGAPDLVGDVAAILAAA